MSTPDSTSRTEEYSKFLAQGPSAQRISGWLIQFLEWKFCDLRNLHDPALKNTGYLWRPDDTVNQSMTKGILIRTASDYSPRDAEQRPALIIKRGAQSPDYRNRGLNMGAIQTAALIGSGADTAIYPVMGQEKIMNWVEGDHTVFCISASGAAAEILGQEVWHEMLDLQSKLLHDCILQTVRIGQLTPVQPLREYRRNWVTAFVVNYTYQRITILGQESPLLKGIDIETSTT